VLLDASARPVVSDVPEPALPLSLDRLIDPLLAWLPGPAIAVPVVPVATLRLPAPEVFPLMLPDCALVPTSASAVAVPVVSVVALMLPPLAETLTFPLVA
jgi:hypothetical protein